MKAAFSLLVALLVLPVTPASAAQSTPPDTVLEARVRAVASELRCPVCQGESIQDSPSALAQEMRAIVREQLAAGKSPEDVKRYFTDKYGEWILLRPRAVGWNVLVYVLPLLALLLGIAVVMRSTRRWAARPRGAPVIDADPDEAQTG